MKVTVLVKRIVDEMPFVLQLDFHNCNMAIFVIDNFFTCERSSISLLTMATTSIPHRWKYDVFVSFRGDDIRKSFMDHMFSDFKQKGIHAFRDDNELPKGEEISPHLYKAIEESRFLIVIFSKNYASSSWCLRELVKILECKQIENPKYVVRIIFYDVKPDVVRKQTGSYAEAFANHVGFTWFEFGWWKPWLPKIKIKRGEVDKWKATLSMAANLSGWDLHEMTNGYESKFIDCISKEILIKLCNGALHIGENLVGIDGHFNKLDLSRFVESHKVNMIGICGISGIGKTTLAKAIYNLMYKHFEGSSFCDDVQGVSERLGLTQVQMQLIDDIMKTRDVKISNIGQGIMAIKKMMSSKPVLLVLDNVDHREQLEALAGSASWFCPGSLIIFTGKDKQLLRSHGVDEIHEIDFLNADESLKLFSSYAFEGKHPSRGFEELAEKAVKYVQGHPFALKVLGCFLYSKTVGQWVSELDRLKVHPNEEIQKVLRLSYDGLDLQQQNILLDIACLFIGVEYDFAASILDGCNFFAYTNMRVLVDKSLITISSNNTVQMHDLIQAMARKIVREDFSPGKQRRLCISSEVYNGLSNKKVAITDAVEVLVLLLEKHSQKVHIDATDFAHMTKLRILKIYQEDKFAQESELKRYNVIFSGSFDSLSSELRLFCWHGFPFNDLPSDFYPENIVAIDLSYSNIKQLWTTSKCLKRLKVMNLRHCCNLTSTPDFSEIRNLEELYLEGCVNLITVHPSIRMLKRLVVVNIKNCERLSFSSNLKMDKLPEDFAERPSSVRSLTNLVYMSLGECVKILSRWWTTSIFRSFLGLDDTAKAELPSKQLHPKYFHDGPLHVGENLVVGNPGASYIGHRWKYDVFVSFKGEDIRRNFMDHLFNDFKLKGIFAFRDDNELLMGEEMSPHIYKAIEDSRFLIVIFTKNYASSSWRLQELVKILECKQIERPRYEVHTVFYDVKPDMVRKQTDSYAEAFDKHQRSNRPEVDNWKEALSTAANISGWDLQDMKNGYEYKFIDSISKDVLKILCDGPLHVGENLVGIDLHFDELNLSRFVGSDKVNMIGISGISGIGKTILAKAIYNLMYVHFEGSCFCEDVKGVAKRQGLIQVQLHMIGKIMKIEDLKISSVGEGIMVIKRMMSSKPILLVLDDVDDREQLEALAGSPTWFCPGSLIIFTGNDKQVLRSQRVEIHDIKFLDEDKSLELFYSYAFKEKKPSTGFKEVAEEVVKYVQGHPLALKVLGHFLYGKTTGQWVSELEWLKVRPNEHIQRVLRLSCDGLNVHQQSILLDIACLFIGENRDFVASVLDGCNFFADTNIRVLVDKSLITISSTKSLQMNNLIQAMAREIVFEESNRPGNRSRLWANPSEVYYILSEKKVTQAVEIIDLQQMKSSQKFDIDGKVFAQMKNLRILKLPMDNLVNFSGRLEFLSNELRLLCWHGCPFKLLPSNFYPENIVSIDLSYSQIQDFWTTPLCFRRLKWMNLSYCHNLTSTPDFTNTTNLQELIIEGCENLVKVHPSIRMLKKLVIVNMRNCKRLKLDDQTAFVW
ncbi:NB-ARC domains-containing protein [Tanacetum coccineum]